MRIISICLAAAVAAFSSPLAAQQYRPSFHPDELKGPATRAPNEVLVLGSPHLRGYPATLTPALLEPLISRLERWRPSAISVEVVAGLQCENLRRYPTRYAVTVEQYCPNPALAAAASGMDVPAANAEVERLLADWPQTPSASQRRRLALLFLAAGEPNSAVVQWLRLAPSERRSGDGLTEQLTKLLNERTAARDESVIVAAALAARLGLERVWSVDDHSADFLLPKSQEAAFGRVMTEVWTNPVARERNQTDTALMAQVDAPDGILTIYRAYNSPSAAVQAYLGDFRAAQIEPSPEHFGRRYLGFWETRNLRMVANIRDVLGSRPGTRMLSIVGASHKGYYEAYLNQMHDVVVVSSATVLR